MKRILFLLSLLLCHYVYAQKTVNDLFTVSNTTSAKLDKIIGKYTILDVNDAELLQLSQTSFDNLLIKVPFDTHNSVELSLTPNKIFSNNFRVTTSGVDGKQTFNYKPGKYYNGGIAAQNRSVAAASFFGDNIAIVFADVDGNINLEKVKTNDPAVSGKYILYREKDMLVANSFRCGMGEPGGKPSKEINSAGALARTGSGNSICEYFDCDYQMYLDNGSNITNVLNYFTGLFNIVSTLYANENINLSVSAVNVWTSQDPYSGGGSSSYLASFESNLTSFPGDVAALLSTKNLSYGGIADDIGTLCTTNSYNYCDLENPATYYDAVTYSWAAELVTHELGHNLGSRHTHACVWNGNNTAIDACAPTYGGAYEGTCSGAPLPTNGGTIMSYCHLGSVGINFLNGFGPQPAAKMRDYISAATCTLGACNNTSCSAPSNDNCDSAITLTVSGSTCIYAFGTTCGATPSSPAISPACGDSSAVAKDVWYKFVATTSNVTINVQSSLNFDAVVQVFSSVNCTSSSYTQLRCVDSSTNAGLETVPLSNLTPGNTYWVRVYNKLGTPATFQICAGHPPTNLLDCSNAIALTCGQTYSGTTTGGNSDVSTYNCAPGWTELGPEKVFTITTTNAGDLTVMLNSVNYQQVFILDSCSTSRCKAYGSYSATYYSAPAGTYYIVVDGGQGASGSFDLTVVCPPLPLDCSNATPLTCNTPVTGTTVGGATNVSSYSCTGNYEIGPEKVYTITTTSTGNLTVNMNTSGQLTGAHTK